jgi:hypothetical protein
MDSRGSRVLDFLDFQYLTTEFGLAKDKGQKFVSFKYVDMGVKNP